MNLARKHGGADTLLGKGGPGYPRKTTLVDAGTIVHPDGALAQVEGAALGGVSLALHEGSEFVKGRVKDTNLDTYTPMRMGDVPETDMEFMPGTTVIGPAIGNAIFAAVGARLRHLPIRPDTVLRALTTRDRGFQSAFLQRGVGLNGE